MKGPGKVLFEQWARKIKVLNISLFTLHKEQMCGCPSCELVREMQSIFKLWMDAEAVIQGGKK